MPRLGLCCMFLNQPFQFRTTTATHIAKLPRSGQLKKLSVLCLANARSLRDAVLFCGAHRIGCFRVNSCFWPVKTHPAAGYAFSDLPDAALIADILSECREQAISLNVRLSFHPDQFVLLNSPKPDVISKSIDDLEYHAELSAMIGADVINIHAGGGYGDKSAALARLAQVLERLSGPVRSRLTLENDDHVYTPADLLPFCNKHQVPLVYDVHHHRCLPDGLTVAEVTRAAVATWNREPLFHISSPRQGWQGERPERHHDYIDKNDFPAEWTTLDMTIEVEAKAKELAVLKLMNDLSFK